MQIFKNEGFRARFNMYPLTKPPTSSSPYVGTLVKRAPISQAELNSTYRGPSPAEAANTNPLTSNPLAKLVGGVVKNVKEGAEGFTKSTRGMVDDKLKARTEKANRKDVKTQADNYEKQRQREIREELEGKRIAEAERKRQKRARKSW